MSIFDEEEFKNKDKVKDLKEQFSKKEIYFDDMPVDVIVKLLETAVEKIDNLSVGARYGVIDDDFYDERDFKDILCDKEFIVDMLFDDLQEKIDIGCYK